MPKAFLIGGAPRVGESAASLVGDLNNDGTVNVFDCWQGRYERHADICELDVQVGIVRLGVGDLIADVLVEFTEPGDHPALLMLGQNNTRY